MRQFWCIGISAFFFANSIPLSASPAENAAADSAGAVVLNCQILTQASAQSLKLTLSAQELLPDSSHRKLLASLEHSGTNQPEQLKGYKESYSKNVLDLERIDYQPLELLGLAEFDIAHVAFYFAKDESAEANPQMEFKFALTSIFKSSQEGELVYAGSYGSYDYENVICRP